MAGPVSIAVAVGRLARRPRSRMRPQACEPARRRAGSGAQAGDPDRRHRRFRLRGQRATLGIEGNRDLFMNTVNWLAQQENLIAIRPREAADRRITLTANTATGMFWISIVRDSGDRPRRRRLHLVAEALAMRRVWSTVVLVLVLGGPGRVHLFRRLGTRSRAAPPPERSHSPRCRPMTSRKCRSRAPTARRPASRRTERQLAARRAGPGRRRHQRGDHDRQQSRLVSRSSASSTRTRAT